MIRFYSPDLTETGHLPEDESVHCSRVLRLKSGAEIDTVDGDGNAYHCCILDSNPKGVSLEILSVTSEPKCWKGSLTLAVAPTKNADRMEWLVEKAVEMGVDEIVLLKCDHSERKVMKLDRLHRIIVSAMKQSLKATLPEICPMTPFKRFVEQMAGVPQKFIAHCDSASERRLLSREYRPGADCVVAIGPEGDFSPEEIDMALEAGFIPVSLGEARLRTETAALLACHTLHTVAEIKQQ